MASNNQENRETTTSSSSASTNESGQDEAAGGELLFRVENPRTIKVEPGNDMMFEEEAEDAAAADLSFQSLGAGSEHDVGDQEQEQGANEAEQLVLEIQEEIDEEDVCDAAEFEIQLDDSQDGVTSQPWELPNEDNRPIHSYARPTASKKGQSLLRQSALPQIPTATGTATAQKTSTSTTSATSAPQDWDASSADRPQLLNIVAMLREEIRKKERTIKSVVAGNSQNILRARQHIARMEKNFNEKNQQKAAECEKLRRTAAHWAGELAKTKEQLKRWGIDGLRQL